MLRNFRNFRNFFQFAIRTKNKQRQLGQQGTTMLRYVPSLLA